MPDAFPRWVYYPQSSPPPEWVAPLVAVFEEHRKEIESSARARGVPLESDGVLRILREDLVSQGFHVEKSKLAADRIFRPVFFGEFGRPGKTYNIDAYNPTLRVGLEVEAGRGTKGNAVYRDLIQTSLLVDVDYLAMAVLTEYKYGKKAVENSYKATQDLLDAIYGSGRLKFPMKGILLIGY